jgi:hypothetical protein
VYDQITATLYGIQRNIVAAMVMREAGRLAGGQQRIMPDNIHFAVEDVKRVLVEMQKNRL